MSNTVSFIVVGNYASMTGASGAMTQVRCSGSETNLARCPHFAWNDNTCSIGPHAGVQCIGAFLYLSLIP